jgi:hypothetical protein
MTSPVSMEMTVKRSGPCARPVQETELEAGNADGEDSSVSRTPYSPSWSTETRIRRPLLSPTGGADGPPAPNQPYRSQAPVPGVWRSSQVRGYIKEGE